MIHWAWTIIIQYYPGDCSVCIAPDTVQNPSLIKALSCYGHCSTHHDFYTRLCDDTFSASSDLFQVLSLSMPSFSFSRGDILSISKTSKFRTEHCIRDYLCGLRLSSDRFRASSWTPFWTVSWCRWSLQTRGRPRPPLKNCCGRVLPVPHLLTPMNPSLKSWRRANGSCRWVLYTASFVLM